MFECQYIHVFFVSQKKVFNHKKKNMEFLHNAITKSMPGTIHFPFLQMLIDLSLYTFYGFSVMLFQSYCQI